MFKIVKKLIVIVTLVALLVVGLKVFSIVYDGYNLYVDAINEVSLDEMVKQIQSKDNYVTLDEISQDYIDQLLDSEDRDFYKHEGFNLKTTIRALFTNAEKGYYAEGGSTITQQLAKNMYFTFAKVMERKVAELLVAKDLENNYSKETILELYLNIIFYGENCYGIEEASNHYYGVSALELNDEQIKVLVRTVKSPSTYNPNTIDQ